MAKDYLALSRKRRAEALTDAKALAETTRQIDLLTEKARAQKHKTKARAAITLSTRQYIDDEADESDS